MNIIDKIKGLKKEEKRIPKHIEFTNNVFLQLNNFSAEHQVEILSSLKNRLIEFYNRDIEESLKAVEECKSKRNLLNNVKF